MRARRSTEVDVREMLQIVLEQPGRLPESPPRCAWDDLRKSAGRIATRIAEHAVDSVGQIDASARQNVRQGSDFDNPVGPWLLDPLVTLTLVWVAAYMIDGYQE
jgi:hypothetical protein